MSQYISVLLLAFLASILPQALTSNFAPIRPPALPLAVKSPYLSTWLNAGNNGEASGVLPGRWPVHWT